MWQRFTEAARRAVFHAQAAAQRFGQGYVSTEHLLLGLLREHDGVAAQVLMNLGLKLEEVREEVLNLLGHNPMPNENEPAGGSEKEGRGGAKSGEVTCSGVVFELAR